jgi:hypothetical protein
MSKGAKGWTDTTFLINSLANFSPQRTCTHSPPLASLSLSLSLISLSHISFSLMFSVNQQLFCLSQHRSLIYSRIWTQQCCGILGHAKPSWILPKTNLKLHYEWVPQSMHRIVGLCTLPYNNNNNNVLFRERHYYNLASVLLLFWGWEFSHLGNNPK